MSHILRKIVEERRMKLINILKLYNVYQDEEQLLKLSLTELEEEYKRIQSESHPHSEMGSIHWRNLGPHLGHRQHQKDDFFNH